MHFSASPYFIAVFIVLIPFLTCIDTADLLIPSLDASLACLILRALTASPKDVILNPVLLYQLFSICLIYKEKPK